MSHDDRARDELLSAHLDGETTADDDARIAADPALQARLADFDEVRHAIRSSSPTLDPAALDELLSRVYARLDQPIDGPRAIDVVPIQAARRKRRWEPSQILATAAAFIAIALLGGALVMLGNSAGGGDDDASSTAESASTEMSTQGDALSGGGSGREEAPSNDAAEADGTLAGQIDLGEFATLDDLEAELRSSILAYVVPADDRAAAGSTDGAESPPTATANEFEGAGVDADCGLAEQPVHYRATVDGRAVHVVVEAPLARVIDAQTCTEVRRITQQ